MQHFSTADTNLFLQSVVLGPILVIISWLVHLYFHRSYEGAHGVDSWFVWSTKDERLQTLFADMLPIDRERPASVTKCAHSSSSIGHQQCLRAPALLYVGQKPIGEPSLLHPGRSAE